MISTENVTWKYTHIRARSVQSNAMGNKFLRSRNYAYKNTSAWKIPLEKKLVHVHFHLVKKELNIFPVHWSKKKNWFLFSFLAKEHCSFLNGF